MSVTEYSHKRIDATTHQIDVVASDGSIIFYSPSKDEYLLFEQSDAEMLDALATEAYENQKLREQIFAARSEKDTQAMLQKTKEVNESVAQFFKGVELDNDDALEELYTLKKNRKQPKLASHVFIRPYKLKNGKDIKGHWRKNNDKTVQKKLQDAREQKTLSSEITDKLVDKNKESQWPWTWKVATDQKKIKDNKYFDAGAAARVCRFAAGVSVGSKFDLAERTFSLTGNGKVSYALAEGTISGTWFIPEKDGIDLFSLVKKNPKFGKALEANRQCNILVTVQAKGACFAAASISAAVALPNIDLNVKTVKKNSGQPVVETSAEGSVYAGVRAEGSLGLALSWRRGIGESFSDLGSTELGAGGGIGAALEGSIKISYEKGTFHFQMMAGAVVGIGGKGSISFAVGLGPGVELIAHILVCVDYHYVVEIEKAAFEAFRDYTFVKIKSGGKIVREAALAAMEEVRDIGGWIKKNTAIANAAPIKAVKTTLRSVVHNSTFPMDPAPETWGGQVLRTIMSTVEPDDFAVILTVLKSAKTSSELKWIIRCVVDYVQDDKDGSLLNAGIDKLLTYGKNISTLSERYRQYKKDVEELLLKKEIFYV